MKKQSAGIVQPGEQESSRETLFWLLVSKGGMEKDFTMVCSDRLRANSFELEEGRLILNIRYFLQ